MKKIYFLFVAIVTLIQLKSFAQCQTPSVVPYYEGFQGITVNNQLPPCWAVSNTAQCITSPGGTNNGIATFYAPPLGGAYFYTNGILLQSGITYSVASRYQAYYYGFGGFSMGVGPNQSTIGLQTIASTTNSGANNSFTTLSNTFTVQFPGIYYFAIKGSASCINCYFYFTWDDFSVTIPCTAVYN